MPSKVSVETGVPDAVFAGLWAVRECGATNMLAMSAVADIASELGHDECADWIDDNEDQYGAVLMKHFPAWMEERDAEAGEA